eukprot:11139394-Ditylum_brightwellii.AAC.1
MSTYTREAYTDLVCDFGGWGTTWFHPNGIANILLLHRAKDKWYVTYASTGNDIFKVHKPDHIVLFIKSDNALYYHDISHRSVVLPDELLDQAEHNLFVTTID